MDVSFLLTVEVFSLTVRLSTCGGGTVSTKDQTQFLDGGSRNQKRPNPISGREGGGNSKQKGPKPIFPPYAKEDQTEFQP